MKLKEELIVREIKGEIISYNYFILALVYFGLSILSTGVKWGALFLSIVGWVFLTFYLIILFLKGRDK